MHVAEHEVQGAGTPRRLCILGATGSIGRQTLEVVARNPERFQVSAVTGSKSVDGMARICEQFTPKSVVMADSASAAELSTRLRAAGNPCEVLAGERALAQVAGAADSDIVVAGIVGAAGLASTWAAVSAGKRVLLANKESMVMAGRLLMGEVARAGAQLLPIDSEHNAILQALPLDYGKGLRSVGVRRILLTASGGPFRTTPLTDLATVTPAQACEHPNWRMGPKISVDSATMLNKGLEVIEARWLFDAAPDMIEVVVHPQSIVHSLVEYLDGSVLAQLSHPDMRVPIAHALAFPERIESGARYLDLFELAKLEFEPPDLARFPCLGLAFQSMRAGSDAPIVLNAANEVAVAAFLDERIGYTQIAAVIDATLASVNAKEPNNLGEVMEIDRRARDEARRQALKRTARKAA